MFDARFRLVCGPSADGALVVVTRQPTHNALLVKDVSAGKSAEHGCVLVAFQTDGAFGGGDHPGRNLEPRAVAAPLLLLLMTSFGVGQFVVGLETAAIGTLSRVRAQVLMCLRRVMIAFSVRSPLAMSSPDRLLVSTHAFIISVHQIFGARRFRLDPFLLQLLLRLPNRSVVVLQYSTLLANEHQRLRTEFVLCRLASILLSVGLNPRALGVAADVGLDAGAEVLPDGQVVDVLRWNHRM